MSPSRFVSCRLFVCALSVFASHLGSASAGQTEDLAKGASLMAEARKAIGGDKLSDVKRLQIKGTMRRGQGNVTLEGDSEVFLEPPDRFRRNESLSIGIGGPGIERVEILNGTEVIDENTGGGRGGFARGGDFGGGTGGDFPRGRDGGFRQGGAGVGGNADGQAGGRGPQIDPERLKEAQRRTRQAEVARLLVAMLLQTSVPVAWIGTAQSPEGTADVLEIKETNGPPIRLFLESATHMPLMLTWSGGGARRGRGASGQSATLEMHLSDYKAVGGLKLPHLITRGTNGETSEEWAVKNYRINPTFKANTFTK